MKTSITKQITGDLDFLYSTILEKSKHLKSSGYDAETTGVDFDNNKTLLSFFFKNKDKILNGDFNKVVARSKGVGKYLITNDEIILSSEKTKTCDLLIKITVNWYNYIYDGRNDNSYWDSEVDSYLIAVK